MRPALIAVIFFEKKLYRFSGFIKIAKITSYIIMITPVLVPSSFIII